MALFFSLPSRMEDLALFTRHLAGAMQARAPLPDILRAYVRDAEPGKLTRALGKIADRLESGVDLSVALEEYSDIFPASYRRLVRLGEQGRTLSGVMNQLADHLEEGLKTYEFFRRAAIYPLIVCIVLFLDVVFLAMAIVPRLNEIGSQLNMEMGMLSAVSGNQPMRLVLILLGLLMLVPILFFLATVFGLRVNGWGYGRRTLQLPLVGPVLRRAETARFASHLSLLLRNRIPLAEALGLMADSAENTYVRDVIADFQERYQRGERLSDMMTAQPLFPATMATVVAAAEDQGGLAESLQSLGRFYSERTSHGLVVLREVFEPIMLILIGLLVGVVLLSLYYPLFRIVKVIPGE